MPGGFVAPSILPSSAFATDNIPHSQQLCPLLVSWFVSSPLPSLCAFVSSGCWPIPLLCSCWVWSPLPHTFHHPLCFPLFPLVLISAFFSCWRPWDRHHCLRDQCPQGLHAHRTYMNTFSSWDLPKHYIGLSKCYQYYLKEQFPSRPAVNVWLISVLIVFVTLRTCDSISRWQSVSRGRVMWQREGTSVRSPSVLFVGLFNFKLSHTSFVDILSYHEDYFHVTLAAAFSVLTLRQVSFVNRCTSWCLPVQPQAALSYSLHLAF